MSDWIKTDRAIYRREKISGVKIYEGYCVEVLVEGSWREYYKAKFTSCDENTVKAESAKVQEKYRKLCAELE